jgi:hypothetical protein
MQRILWLWLLVALFLGIALCTVAFGQVPPIVLNQNPQQANQVMVDEFLDFSGVFDTLAEAFGSLLAEYYGFLLSVFFVWFILGCIKSFLEGKMEIRMAELKKHERIQKRVAAIEERKEAHRIVRQLEMERRIEQFEAGYRSRELQGIVLRNNEKLVAKDGNLYVGIRTESGDVIATKTLNEWRRGNRSDSISVPFIPVSHSEKRSWRSGSDYYLDWDRYSAIAEGRKFDGSAEPKPLREFMEFDSAYSDNKESIEWYTGEEDVNNWREDFESEESVRRDWYQPRRPHRENFSSGFDDSDEYEHRTGRSGVGY